MTDNVLFTEYPAHAGANFTNKPDAVIRDGRLPELIDRVEQYLIKAGAPIYQRDGRLVKVGWHRFPKRHPFLGIETIHPLNLAETLTRLIVWKKYDARRKAHTMCDCPRSVAETYLARSGQWLVPTIRSVITAPTLREDGSVLDQPGF